MEAAEIVTGTGCLQIDDTFPGREAQRVDVGLLSIRADT